MAQNIYDSPQFFERYSQLARSVDGLDGAPEWSAIRAMLPPMRGKRIVDLGCGFGWFVRWARMQGAVHVLGIDLSDNMLSRARGDSGDPAVEYLQADLENLELPDGAYDFAYSSLAFHYVEDFGTLIRKVFSALVPEAQLVFSVEHPIYMAPTHPGWVVAEDGRKTWPIDRYAIEGARTTEWLGDRVLKRHRTLATTLNALIDSGFAIRHVQEWHPTADQVKAQPTLAEELERPMMLLVAAQK